MTGFVLQGHKCHFKFKQSKNVESILQILNVIWKYKKQKHSI